MMRESLFDQLGDLSGHSWLDLFTGSGCVGIEAASRNASPVVLVEMDRGKRETILKNIRFVESDIQLVIADVWKYIPTAKAQFHYIYADPPFAMKGELEKSKADLTLYISLEERRKTLEDGKPCPLCGSTTHPYAVKTPPLSSHIDDEIEKVQMDINMIPHCVVSLADD